MLPGCRVQVYRNLHKPGVTYSIRHVKSGLVLGHATNLLLTDCQFKVSWAGREKVRKTKKKNVHAWVEGSFAPVRDWTDKYYNDGLLIGYNPYKNNSFITMDDGDAIWEAGIVYIRDGNVWAH